MDRDHAKAELLENCNLYDPVEGTALISYLGYPAAEEPACLLYHVSVDDLEAIIESHPELEYLDELSEAGLLGPCVLTERDLARATVLVASRGSWVSPYDMRSAFVARCRSVLAKWAQSGTRYVPAPNLERTIASASWNTLWNPASSLALTWEDAGASVTVFKLYAQVDLAAIAKLDGDASRVERSWQDSIFNSGLRPCATWSAPTGLPLPESLISVAAIGGWVECVTMDDGMERYGSAMDRQQTVAWACERETRVVGSADQELGQLLAVALELYESEVGWRDLPAEDAVRGFVRYLTSGECPVSLSREGVPAKALHMRRHHNPDLAEQGAQATAVHCDRHLGRQEPSLGER